MPKAKKRARALVEGAGPAIDLDDHIATRIAIFANRVSRAASRFYRDRYGIGVVEWRVLMFVGQAKQTSANRICSETDLDKGAVSRSLNVLARMGAVSVKADGADSRRHNVALTAKGRSLHDRIVPVALERQRDLLRDLSPAEVETLKDIIVRMQARVGDSKAPPEQPSPKRPPASRPALRRSARRDELPRRRATARRG
jgi:DNA-binding MarR family transcriptional regulator